jgi:hypothetical protein
MIVPPFLPVAIHVGFTTPRVGSGRTRSAFLGGFGALCPTGSTSKSMSKRPLICPFFAMGRSSRASTTRLNRTGFPGGS